MKLTISPKAIISVTSPSTYVLGLGSFNVLVKVNGDIIYNDDPVNNVGTNGICYDSKGQAIDYICDIVGASDESVEVNLNFHNNYDHADVEILVESVGYKAYHKVIRVYGIDVNLDVIMVDDTLNGTVNVVTYTTIYRPLSKQVFIYRNTNANYTNIRYSDLNNTTLSNTEDFNITLIEDIFIACSTTITTSSFTSGYFSLYSINWNPTIGISMDCNMPCNECFNKLTDNTIHAYLTYNTNLISFNVDGVNKLFGIFDNFGVRFSVTNVDSDILYDGSKIVDNPNLPNNIIASDSFNITETGDFMAYAEIENVGDYVLSDLDTLQAGKYFVLNHTGNISNLLTSGIFYLFEIITINSGTPTIKGNMKLVKVIDSSSTVIDEGYYYVLDSIGLDVNGVTFNDGDKFYLNTNDVINLTSTAKILPLSVYYSCMASLSVKGCEPYDVKQVECNKFDLMNRSLQDELFSVYKLTNSLDDVWELKAEDLEVKAGENYTITFTTDGVYRIDINGTQLIIINTCDLEKCKLEFLKKITCCSDDSKCNEYDHIRFNSKEFYNYNAFLLIVHSLYQIIDVQYKFFDALTTITDAKLKMYFEINTLLDRAYQYCGECTKC